MKLDLGRRLSTKLNLVFYSGGIEPSNKLLHEELAQIKKRRAKSLTYIPYSHENGLFFYRRIQKRYKKVGIKKFRYFSVDSDFLRKEMREALKSDIIYLAGGNTFYFLKHLRESGFLKELERFARRGGIIAGLSAGAIIMTPHILLAGYPPHEGDENEVRLKNLKSLGLVNFEFLPHFTNSPKTNRAMLSYSRKHSLPVIACPDGSGVIVKAGQLRFVGPFFIFYRGKKIRL